MVGGFCGALVLVVTERLTYGAESLSHGCCRARCGGLPERRCCSRGGWRALAAAAIRSASANHASAGRPESPWRDRP